MIRKLVDRAVANPLAVLVLLAALAAAGGYALTHVNIEAYPDPAPAIIEVVAQYPGASAEEVERQVTVPLEVALAGMPGLETTRSKKNVPRIASQRSPPTGATRSPRSLMLRPRMFSRMPGRIKKTRAAPDHATMPALTSPPPRRR